MPTIHEPPPAPVQNDLNNLAQALNTIVPTQIVPELKPTSQTITTRSKEATPQLDLLMRDYIVNAKANHS